MPSSTQPRDGFDSSPAKPEAWDDRAPTEEAPAEEAPWPAPAPPKKSKAKSAAKKKKAKKGAAAQQEGEAEDSPSGTSPHGDSPYGSTPYGTPPFVGGVRKGGVGRGDGDWGRDREERKGADLEGVRLEQESEDAPAWEEFGEPTEAPVDETPPDNPPSRHPTAETAMPPPETKAPPTPPPAPSPSLRSPRPSRARPLASPPTRLSSLYAQPQQPTKQAYPYRPTPSHHRRESSTTHTSPRPAFVEPTAPPHKVQPHYYAVPDIGLDIPGAPKRESHAGKPAGTAGHCCSFDTFADAGDGPAGKKARDALLVGSEGGLDVLRVLPGKIEVVGRLEGLRGAVIGAKIIPRVGSGRDAFEGLRPLVAVVVHGPMGPRETETGGGREARWQTSVEVYSLLRQELVAILYRSVPVAVGAPAMGRVEADAPRPVGDLSVDAQGKFVVVASGRSGEVWVFSAKGTAAHGQEAGFRCVGKFWTALQTALDAGTRAGGSSSDGSQASDDADDKPGVPLYSLSARWLALVSPATASHVSIAGTPLVSETAPAPPSLATHVAPPQPPVTADLAGVDAEAAWARFTRQAAQGVVKYSQKGLELGWQGWRELTNPTPQPGTAGYNAASHGRSRSRSDRESLPFPPTKAPPDDHRRLAREPTVISLLDLDALIDAEEAKPKSPAAVPLSTFALPDGCNHLSLSPSGLRLLTVSRRGDVSAVWDLLQAFHGSLHPTHTIAAGGEDGSEDAMLTGPCVRLLTKFTRASHALVLATAWTRDADALALLTANGTVHLHEVLDRPPEPRKRKRRSLNTPAAATSIGGGSQATAAGGDGGKAQAMVGVSQGASPPSSVGAGLLSRFSSGWASVGNQVSSLRGAPVASATDTASQPSATTDPSSPADTAVFAPSPTHAHTATPSSTTTPLSLAGLKSATASASHASTRALAHGLSKGFTAAKGGAADYWHADDNKVRLKPAPSTPSAHPHGGGGGAGGMGAGASAGSSASPVADSPPSLRWLLASKPAPGSAAPSAAGSLAVVGPGGVVALHPVARTTRRKGEEFVRGLKAERSGRREFVLPGVRMRVGGAGVGGDGRGEGVCEGMGVHGFWSLRAVSPPGGFGAGPGPGAAPSAPARIVAATKGAGAASDDVETNPPFCPFHIDARVGVWAFADEAGLEGAGGVSGAAWAFGGKLSGGRRVGGLSGVRGGEGWEGFGGSAGKGPGRVGGRAGVVGDAGAGAGAAWEEEWETGEGGLI